MKDKVLLDLHNLSCSYDNKNILSGIYLKISSGDRILLIGANGSGKSTLLKEILKTQNHLNLTYLSHNPGIYLDLTVHENLEFFNSLSKHIKNINKIVSYWHLTEQLHLTANKLSKGQLQRLALAVTFLKKPELILLDEPSSNLDPLGTELLLNYLEDFEDTGCLIASHDLLNFGKWCNRIVAIEHGTLKEIKTDELRSFYFNIIK